MGEGQTERLPANLFQLRVMPLLCLSSRSHAASAKLLGRALQGSGSDPVLVLGKVQVMPAASDTLRFLSSHGILGNLKPPAAAAVFVLWRKFPSQLMEGGRWQGGGCGCVGWSPPKSPSLLNRFENWERSAGWRANCLDFSACA